MRIAPEIADALAGHGPVVALETTLVAHGFPRGEGLEVGRACEAAVRAAGAIPATIGILDGEIHVGLDDEALQRFGDSPDARKAGPRDLAACAAQGAIGATTVGGTLTVCRGAGIVTMGTGGIGGVHRGWARSFDISADIGALSNSPVLVVAAGVKSILDVPATAELLETFGVPVLGYRTDELPLFYRADGGPPVSARVESAAEAAEVAKAHWSVGGCGLLLARPPDVSLDVEPLIEAGLAEAERQAVRGQAVTPFVLAFLHERSGGETVQANKRLVVANAGLAGEVAVALGV
jgi:pseudouridine-5'-phosphate glycosidase